jgi:hypothetical protein
LSDYECLCDSAWALKSLSNNRTFLAEAINRELRTFLDGGRCPSLTANSITLFNTRSYTIRANIWAPLGSEPRKHRLEATAFSYFAYHDHNFHFVTAGYLGSGYETVLYRHRFERDRGAPNATADLRYVEQIRLRRGDVMVYRAFEDVHAQLPPDEVSISLNLMAHPPEIARQPQYFFDMDTRTIASAVSDGHDVFGTFIRMAQHIGDANTPELLMALAGAHPAPVVRDIALQQLMVLCPQESDYFLSAFADPPGRPQMLGRQG